MPLSSEEIPLGSAINHRIHGYHYVFHVSADRNTIIIANGDSGPVLATRQFGKGIFIYHGALQPLIGHTVYDPSMYAYLIYRDAIEWAFEKHNLPIIKLSPWRYEYDAAFLVRHDFENNAASIRSIKKSASFEHSAGVKGDYYFCTGALREEMPDKKAVISDLRRAITNYGATIGSHNGGLKNPVVSLPIKDFDYWHWGPDEALGVTLPGYSSGKAYAQASILKSFQDVEGWLAGLDNGRSNCGSKGNCPRIWVAPYLNSTREDSYGILESLGIVSVGEQKIGPFPHRTVSTQTPGKRYSFVSIPTSEWYVGTEIPGALEWGHTTASMQAAVDFYYNLGASINLYGHIPSDADALVGQYINYCVTKTRMWATNAAGMAEWWKERSKVAVKQAYSMTGNTATAQATITGASDAGTSIEMYIPNLSNQVVSNVQVAIDNATADPDDYRIIGNKIKLRIGTSASSAKVRYTINYPIPAITSLSPATYNLGGSAFTLIVNGMGFTGDSFVQWNGTNRTTAYISSTQLMAEISAMDAALEGAARVMVINPAPGGGTSNLQTVAIAEFKWMAAIAAVLIIILFLSLISAGRKTR